MNSFKMKLRISYLWSLIIHPAKFPDAAATRSAAATCCKIAYMLNKLKYEKLESHNLLQIAANLPNFFP